MPRRAIILGLRCVGPATVGLGAVVCLWRAAQQRARLGGVRPSPARRAARPGRRRARAGRGRRAPHRRAVRHRERRAGVGRGCADTSLVVLTGCAVSFPSAERRQQAVRGAVACLMRSWLVVSRPHPDPMPVPSAGRASALASLGSIKNPPRPSSDPHPHFVDTKCRSRHPGDVKLRHFPVDSPNSHETKTDRSFTRASY